MLCGFGFESLTMLSFANSSATLIPALKALLNRIEISFDHCIENRRTTNPETELGKSIPVSGRSCGDRSGLSGLARCSARLDIDCLGGLYGFSGLLDREMQHTLVEMSVDGSVLRLERQEHRSVE